MFTVYLLKSVTTGMTYVGMTEKLAKERLIEHNQGSNQWTSKHKPLKLIYFETFVCKEDALRREKFLKSGVGNRVIKALLREFDRQGL